MEQGSQTYSFLIGEDDIDERVDKFLAKELSDLSRSYIQKLLKEDRVLLAGKPVKANYKLKEEDEKVLKALFITDLLDIVKTIAPEIEKGKQINTLLGASTIDKNVRVAPQKLQIPMRMSMTENKKYRYPSKLNLQKIQ